MSPLPSAALAPYPPRHVDLSPLKTTDIDHMLSCLGIEIKDAGHRDGLYRVTLHQYGRFLCVSSSAESIGVALSLALAGPLPSAPRVPRGVG